MGCSFRGIFIGVSGIRRYKMARKMRPQRPTALAIPYGKSGFSIVMDRKTTALFVGIKTHCERVEVARDSERSENRKFAANRRTTEARSVTSGADTISSMACQ
jgi:hypothetical protein